MESNSQPRMPRASERKPGRSALPLAAVWLFAVSACAPMPELRRPAAPVPNAWPAVTGNGSQVGKIDAAKTHWRAFFPDPRLQALIAIALENNRDLRIAAGRVQEARAQYGMVRADEKPTVNLNGSASTTRTPTDLLNAGDSATTTRFDLSLSTVSFELDFWGRLAGMSSAARASYLATEEARRAVNLSLVADVATAYFSLLQMEELAALARSTVQLRELSLALITKGRDLGGAYDYEYQQASGILESSRANLAALDHQRAVTTNRLNYLLGQVPEALPPGRALSQQGLETDIAAGLPAEVLLLRPDVIAAEQRLVAANANIGAAKAAFFPKILLTAGLGLASQGLLGLFTSGGAWSFQPSISLPLFDGGRNEANVDVARAREVIAVAEYEKTIQQAFREVADLLSARASLARQLEAFTANRTAQARRLEIAEARQAAGLVSYLEVLDAQRELVAAQQGTVQVRRAQLETAAQLYKALGGGDPDVPDNQLAVSAAAPAKKHVDY